ncbi:hypothetical protein [Vulcanisaeta souniana]|nr:hypothetical protein [Vulcanisaeta souniana]
MPVNLGSTPTSTDWKGPASVPVVLMLPINNARANTGYSDDENSSRLM